MLFWQKLLVLSLFHSILTIIDFSVIYLFYNFLIDKNEIKYIPHFDLYFYDNAIVNLFIILLCVSTKILLQNKIRDNILIIINLFIVIIVWLLLSLGTGLISFTFFNSWVGYFSIFAFTYVTSILLIKK